jgi:hypothetical protein
MTRWVIVTVFRPHHEIAHPVNRRLVDQAGKMRPGDHLEELALRDHLNGFARFGHGITAFLRRVIPWRARTLIIIQTALSCQHDAAVSARHLTPRYKT